jgi:hypothetical protein
MAEMLGLARFFPPCGPPTAAAGKLRLLGVQPERYTCMGACVSVLSASAALSFLAISGNPLAVPLAALAGAAAFSLTLALPSFELGKRRAEIECQLPFFLRSLGMLVELGMPFQKAMEIAAEGSGPLGDEIRRALREASEGMPLQRGIAAIARSYGSVPVRRAVAQLLSVYETGGQGREMTKVGDDLLQLEQQGMREYAARGALFGLMFMASSAILPTFFLVYSLSGPGLGAGAMRIAMLAVFPLLGALSLLLSKATMPRTAFGGGAGFEPALMAPGAAMAAAMAFAPSLALPVLAGGFVLCAYLAAGHYLRERRLEDIEAALPDALFSVSGMPRSSGPMRVFSLIEEGGFGALSEEAGKSRRQLAMNNGLGHVLDDLWRRNRSPLLRRAALHLRQMVDTGSLDRMSALADDMTRAFQLSRERRALFAMQKYTLIAGALLIPAILRMTLGLLGSIQAAPQAASDAAAIIPPYLVIYSIMAAAAISDAEGRRSAAASYTAVLAAMGLAAFHFINI